MVYDIKYVTEMWKFIDYAVKCAKENIWYIKWYGYNTRENVSPRKILLCLMEHLV